MFVYKLGYVIPDNIEDSDEEPLVAPIESETMDKIKEFFENNMNHIPRIN